MNGLWRNCLCRNVVQGRFHLLSSKNIPMPVKRGHGSGCFPKHADGKIKKPVSRDGIILILRLFNAPCTKLFYGRVFRSQSVVTRSTTHLQRIYWNPVTISALSKHFPVTVMFQPLWFTPTSSTAAVSAFKALSTECDSPLSHLVKIGLIWLLMMCSGGCYGREMKLLCEVPV